MRLFPFVRTRLQYKIILPFLILTLLVALVGSTVAFLFVVGSAQERLNNQLAQVARAASDRVVERESANLVYLREIAFAGPNVQSGAPAIADAVASGDRDGLAQALDPYFRISASRGATVDRLIAFDRAGHTLVDWERDPGAADGQRIVYPPTDLRSLWFVGQILLGTQDQEGDKYAGLLTLGDGSSRYLFTVAPVVKDKQIVGGVIAAVRMDVLLRELSTSAQAALMTVYEPDSGHAFATSAAPDGGLASLNARSELIGALRDLQANRERGIFDIVSVNRRDYQIAYAPLVIRGTVVALMSVGLATDYVVGPWADARIPLLGLTVGLMLAIIALGIFVARQITRPLEELVSTAQAVTAGDLDRRSQVVDNDEVGKLSVSFNTMTEHLLDLYQAMRAESSQRAAIVESISEAVVVCDQDGQVLLVNRAARALMGSDEGQEPPAHFADVPLAPLRDAALTFGGARASDLYEIRDRVVRVAQAEFRGGEGELLGRVYVLQDLTSEVQTDRAKTDFIATISHELRTPLTVLGGNADLLLRNLVGPLTDEQRMLLETMRNHTQHMTGLVNNVITIAGLDSGSLMYEPEPLAIVRVLNDVLWPFRKLLTTRGVELNIDIPDDLPMVVADQHQLRIVFQQLIDNAARYTMRGSITVRAAAHDQIVQIDICDTGSGVSEEMRARLFTRFSRRAESNNTAERGLGLGLAITRELVERNGGRIWLANTSAHGSTFSFTLPSYHVTEDLAPLPIETAA